MASETLILHSDLNCYPSQSPYEIAQTGFALFKEHYWWPKPVRALTIRGINPGRKSDPVQTDMFNDYAVWDKRRRLDDAVDELRQRFGNRIIYPACLHGKLPIAQDRCETVPMPSPMCQ